MIRMKHVLAALVVAVALVVPSAVATAGDMTDDDTTAIHQIWGDYVAARIAGDADTWLGLWGPEGIQMPPGMPARGVDVLKVGIPKAFEAIDVTAMNTRPDETTVAGDWAWCRGNYDADQVVQGSPVHVDGKFMTIFRRQDDGAWKIYRDIFNANTS